MHNRRTALAGIALGSAAWACPAVAWEPEPIRLTPFEADITPPLGHPLLGGLKPAAKSIMDRLKARGLVMKYRGEKPVAIVALDWCELRNDAYDYARDAIAKAIGTTRDRVLLSCIHQHDAPYCDLTAQKLLDDAGLPGVMFDRPFFEEAIAKIAKAATGTATQITSIGASQAQVERVACNRRVELTGGEPNFSRYSFTSDPAVRDAPDGPIDPHLQTLGFFAGDKLVATVSVYAVHPMSYYGRGEVSADFPGMARDMLDQEFPDALHLYVSGCSGDVVAAKYNAGNEAARLALAERLAAAMSLAVKSLKPQELAAFSFRNTSLELPPPETGTLAPEQLKKTITDKTRSRDDRITAALGLSYWQRCQTQPAINVPCIDFGPACYLVLPAEMFVEYQLAAQKLLPKKQVLIAGFGECAPGYIPTEQARREGFVEEHGYCWNQAGAEPAIMAAVKKVLEVK